MFQWFTSNLPQKNKFRQWKSVRVRRQSSHLVMADTSCKNAGGTLAMIHSYDEHLFIKSVLDNFPMNIQSYKIGGRKDNKGHWKWNDGRPVRHEYWGPDEPNNAGQKENCLEYHLTNSGYVLNDITCTNIEGYICQFDACIYENPQCTNDGKCVRRRLIEDCICTLEQRNQYRCNMDCSPIQSSLCHGHIAKFGQQH